MMTGVELDLIRTSKRMSMGGTSCSEQAEVKLRLDSKPVALQHAIVFGGTARYGVKRLGAEDSEFVAKFSWRPDGACGVIKGHKPLYQDEKVLHRDVSMNNVTTTNAEDEGSFARTQIASSKSWPDTQ
ncbi:MAG: hypothetical protein M1839_005483 [Geoglossum umbratile]|nr:MAG: hypothetical protein M1839_005483 [Geoglossum umbratile]